MQARVAVVAVVVVVENNEEIAEKKLQNSLSLSDKSNDVEMMKIFNKFVLKDCTTTKMPAKKKKQTNMNELNDVDE